MDVLADVDAAGANVRQELLERGELLLRTYGRRRRYDVDAGVFVPEIASRRSGRPDRRSILVAIFVSRS